MSVHSPRPRPCVSPSQSLSHKHWLCLCRAPRLLSCRPQTLQPAVGVLSPAHTSPLELIPSPVFPFQSLAEFHHTMFFFPSEPPRMENTRQSYFKNQQMTQPLGVESGILNSSTALCRRSSGGGLTVPELHPTSSYSHLIVKNGCFFLPHPLSDPEVLSPLFYPAIGFLFSLLANQSIRGTSPTEM